MTINWIKGSRGFLETVLSAKKQFNMLIFFVTSRCNSRCRSCFYWRSLNRGEDLTLPKIEKLASTMPQFKELWLSGGEPMLRRDLVEIIRVFYDNNGLRSVNLPTNGLLPEGLQKSSANTFDSDAEALPGYPGDSRNPYTSLAMSSASERSGRNTFIAENGR